MNYYQKKEGEESPKIVNKVGQKRSDIQTDSENPVKKLKIEPANPNTTVDVELEKLEEELRNDGVDLSNIDDEVDIDT